MTFIVGLNQFLAIANLSQHLLEKKKYIYSLYVIVSAFDPFTGDTT